MFQRIIYQIVTFVRQPLFRLAAVFIIAAVLTFFAFSQAGSWLVVDNPLPERIDVICTFAGDSRRVEYSRELMLKHPDAQWFLSDYKDGYSRLLQRSNFNMKRVMVVDTCKSTFSEVSAFGSMFGSYHKARFGGNSDTVLNVVCVSSPYHMRRIQIMAQRHIKTDAAKISCCPVPLDRYKWSTDTFRFWWRSNTIISITSLEFFKLGYFMLTGFF